MGGCGLLSSSKETRAEVDADGCPSVGTWLSDEEPEIGIIGRTRDRDGDGARDGVLDGVRDAGPKDSQPTIFAFKMKETYLREISPRTRTCSHRHCPNHAPHTALRQVLDLKGASNPG